LEDRVINVLLVEDSESDYIVSREMLNRGTVVSSGRQIKFCDQWANNFSSAVEKLKEQRFDAILLDLNLPDGHGLDCFYSIRALFPHIPILIVTGIEDQQLAIEAVNAGAKDYLIKSELTGGVLVRAIMYSHHCHQLESELESKIDSNGRLLKGNSDFLTTRGTGLRSPLESIVELIEQALTHETSDAARAYFKRIKVSSDLIGSVVSDVIDFSQLEGGKIQLSNFAFKLREYLKPLMMPLEIQAQLRRGTFDFEISDSVPNAVIGDPEKLARVIVNLVRSAFKFTGIGGKTVLRLDVDYKESEKVVLHFWIKMPNIMVPIEKQELIFESFAQADFSAVRKYAGTGLSLALAARFVSLMNGKIWAENDPHLGSSLQFTAQLGLTQI